MIATVVMLDMLQTVDAKPACFCMGFGRSCLRVCRTAKCVNTCNAEKMMCYRNCRRSKKDETMFDALADEDVLDNSL